MGLEADNTVPGFEVTSIDKLINWGANRIAVADDFRVGLLRRLK